MGGEGHIMQMNKMLKENRAARRSKRKGYKDGYDGSTISSGKLIFKELPPEELEQVLLQIQKEKRKERIKQQRLFLTIILFIITIGSLIIFL
ncbi:MAG: hypothetical protein R2780_11400 [Crocinitomicaceae bacterium]|nr:hypothetical protein [Crocinitomicaceae bacterium]